MSGVAILTGRAAVQQCNCLGRYMLATGRSKAPIDWVEADWGPWSPMRADPQSNVGHFFDNAGLRIEAPQEVKPATVDEIVAEMEQQGRVPMSGLMTSPRTDLKAAFEGRFSNVVKGPPRAHAFLDGTGRYREWMSVAASEAEALVDLFRRMNAYADEQIAMGHTVLIWRIALETQDAGAKGWKTYARLVITDRAPETLDYGDAGPAIGVLPAWRHYVSHKRVEAARIARIEKGVATHMDRERPITRLEFGPDADRVVDFMADPDPALFSRHIPQVGDYLVRYPDGYLSISPRKAFEEGYTVEIGG